FQSRIRGGSRAMPQRSRHAFPNAHLRSTPRAHDGRNLFCVQTVAQWKSDVRLRLAWLIHKISAFATSLFSEKPAESGSRRAFGNLTKLFNPQNLTFKSAVKNWY